MPSGWLPASLAATMSDSAITTTARRRACHATTHHHTTTPPAPPHSAPPRTRTHTATTSRRVYGHRSCSRGSRCASPHATQSCSPPGSVQARQTHGGYHSARSSNSRTTKPASSPRLNRRRSRGRRDHARKRKRRRNPWDYGWRPNANASGRSAPSRPSRGHSPSRRRRWCWRGRHICGGTPDRHRSLWGQRSAGASWRYHSSGACRRLVSHRRRSCALHTRGTNNARTARSRAVWTTPKRVRFQLTLLTAVTGHAADRHRRRSRGGMVTRRDRHSWRAAWRQGDRWPH